MDKDLITTRCGVLLLFLTVASTENGPVSIDVNDGRGRKYEVQDSVDHSKYHLVFGNHRETHKGAHVVGEYNLRENNGNIRTVRYVVDNSGFHAQVFNTLEDPHFGTSNSDASGNKKWGQEMVHPHVEDAVFGFMHPNRTSENHSPPQLESHTTYDRIVGRTSFLPRRYSSQILEHFPTLQESDRNNYFLTRSRGTMPLLSNSSRERFELSIPGKFNNTISYSSYRNEEELNSQTNQIPQKISENLSFQSESSPFLVGRNVQPGRNSPEISEEQNVSQQEKNQDNYSSDSNQGRLSLQPNIKNWNSDGNERENVDISANVARGESSGKNFENKGEDFPVNKNPHEINHQLGENGRKYDKPKEIFIEDMSGTSVYNKDTLENSDRGVNSYQPEQKMAREFEMFEDVVKEETSRGNGGGSGQDRRSFHSDGQRWIDEERPENMFKGETLRKDVDDKLVITNSTKNARNSQPGEHIWIDADSFDRVFKVETARQNVGDKLFALNNSQNGRNLQSEDHMWIDTVSSGNVFKQQAGKQNGGDKRSITNGRSFQSQEGVWVDDEISKKLLQGQNVDNKHFIQNSFQSGERESIDSSTERLRGDVPETVAEDKGFVQGSFLGSINFRTYGHNSTAHGLFPRPGNSAPSDGQDNAGDDAAYSRAALGQRSDRSAIRGEEVLSPSNAFRAVLLPYTTQRTRQGVTSSAQEGQYENHMKKNNKQQGTHSSEGGAFKSFYKTQAVEFPSEVRRQLTHKPRIPEWIRDVDQKANFETLH